MGGGGGNDSGGYDDAPMQYQAKKSRKQREEKQLQSFRSGGSYVTSGDDGNIVRTSSGSGVLTSKGVQRKEEFQQAELERTIGGADKQREVAIMQLQNRLNNIKYPSTLGVVAKLNLEKQIKDLQSGKGTAQFSMSEGGRFVATGVTGSSGSGLSPSIKPMFSDSAQSDVSSPEVTPEVVPDDATASATDALLSGGSKTKRTRYKRSGQASDLAGTGVLVRTK